MIEYSCSPEGNLHIWRPQPTQADDMCLCGSFMWGGSGEPYLKVPSGMCQCGKPLDDHPTKQCATVWLKG